MVRLLRWVSILQQKEYRFDRWKMFLFSQEGKRELARLVVIPTSLNQLRRPKMTAKANLLVLLLLVELYLVFKASVLWATVVYLLVPVVVLLNGVLLSLPTAVVGWYWARKAIGAIEDKKPIIVGIIGSYGKTTTKLLLKAVLKNKCSVWVTPKSYNTWISISNAINKTYRNEEVVILEFSAYKKGEIARLAKTFKPNVGVITGIGEQHLGLFGGKKDLIEAKSELLQALDPGVPVVFNSNDSEVVRMVKKYNRLELIPASEMITRNYRLIGKHYAVNVGIAAAVAKHFGLSGKQISLSLKKFIPGEEFIGSKKTKRGATLIIDDKTSNPAGFEAVIDLANDTKAKKKVLIAAGIVDLGSKSTNIHGRLAKRVKKTFDYFVHTSELEEGILKKELGGKYKQVISTNELESFLKKDFGKNDLIVLEGKVAPHLKKVVMSL